MKQPILKNIGLLFSVVFILNFVSCGTGNTQEGQIIPTPTDLNDNQFILDREGNNVQLPNNTNTIVSLSPSITEILIELGLANKIIAVDIHSVGIEGLNNDLPAFDIMTPDIENLLLLNPDIIFLSGMSRVGVEDTFAPITELGTFITYLPAATNIDEIKEDIRFIGEVTTTQSKAEDIITNMENEIKEIILSIENDKQLIHNLIYFEIEPTPNIFGSGSGVFLNEMLDVFCGENMFL